MRADREMRFELQEATSSSLQVLIFHRKMVELTAKEFEQIRELLMNLVSKTSKTPGKVGPLVGPNGPTAISKSKFPKKIGWKISGRALGTSTTYYNGSSSVFDSRYFQL